MHNYLMLKEALINANRLSEVFLKSIDGLACQSIWESPPGLPLYEPLLVEDNLESLWGLLERCLAYRKEARDLEILAVRAAADYNLYLEISELEKQRDLLKLRESQQQVAEQTQVAAVIAFDAGESLSNGFRTLAQGQAEELALDRTALAEERQIITNQLCGLRFRD